MNWTRRIWFGLAVLAAGAHGRSADGPNVADTVRENMRQLRQASVRAPGGREDGSDLQRAVRQVRALQLEPRPRPADGSASPTTASAPVQTRPAGDASASPVAPLPQIPPQVLERMMKLAPGGVPDPTALGDALTLAGHFDAAYVFYDRALKDQPSPEDQAWLLYQMANCRRRSDLGAARTLFQRLLREQPDSPWCPLAEAQDRLLEWYQINKPKDLLDAQAGPTGRAPATAPAGEAAPATLPATGPAPPPASAG